MWRSGPGWSASGWSKGAAVAAGTGWNAATAGPGLSVTGTVVDASGVSGTSTVRTNTSHSTGKYYVEMTITVRNFKHAFGIGNASLPTSGTELGNDAYPSNGAGIFSGSGKWFENSNGTPPVMVTTAGFEAGDIVDLAINLTNNLVWARVNNGAWNSAMGGTQDPTAAPGSGGGMDLANQNGTALAAGPYYLAVSAWLDVITARFTSGSWIHTPPSGYVQF